MTQPVRVSVVDDEQQFAEEWKNAIQALFPVKAGQRRKLDVSTFAMIELGSCIAGLSKRQAIFRSTPTGNTKLTPPEEQAVRKLDETDIFIVDNDLLSEGSIVSYTGEDIAYLARSYSACKVIVAVNQFTTAKDFDLTLAGHPDSFADLHISAPHVANPGLWDSAWAPGFRPWHWPLLPDLAAKFEQRVAFVRTRLDTPLLAAFGFGPAIIEVFPREAVEFLQTSGDPIDRLTFREFVNKSGNALRPKDAPRKGSDGGSDERISRIAAARLGRWLEDYLLNAQEILVDAPHLVHRYPSLLSGAKRRDLRTWNKTARIATATKVGVRSEILKPFAFPDEWLSRPAWRWPSVSACRDIDEVADPLIRKSAEFVFCEDISRFVPKSMARSFTASVPSTYVRRYVLGPESQGGFPGLTDVTYQPAVRFSI